MMKKLIIAVPFLLLLLIFAIPSISFAQYDDDTNIALGPRIGYYEAVDAEEGNFLFGLQLRGHLSDYFGLELAATYRSSTEYAIADGSFETGHIPITASAMLYLPLHEHFMPYGLAGIGGYYTYYDAEGVLGDRFEDEFIFGYHLGFGLEVPINDVVAIDADYRYIFLTPEEGEDDFSGHTVTAGIMFYL